MDQNLSSIDINPAGANPHASVIWLHGLGADANDFVPIVEHLGLADKFNVRFIFPHAPIRPITINGGVKMRGWYDIYALDIAGKEDSIGIQQSAQLVETLIEREKKLNIVSQQIFLAGFSQGGAMALYTGLRHKEPLAGVISLSAYLPLAATLSLERNATNQATPIFMAHGLFDPVVPLMLGEMSRQQLQSLGYKVDWHSYSMPHTVLPEEIEDIGVFLKKILGHNNI